MTKRETALSYLEKGISVIPLKSPVTVQKSSKFKQKVQEEYQKNLSLPEPRTYEEIHKELFYRECKLPLVPWKEYQTRLASVEEVNHWFNTNPDANIGIVTGAVSNLVVFDLDSDQLLNTLKSREGFRRASKSKQGKGIMSMSDTQDLKSETASTRTWTSISVLMEATLLLHLQYTVPVININGWRVFPYPRLTRRPARHG